MSRKLKILTIAAFTAFAASLGFGSGARTQDSSSEQEHPTVEQLVESIRPKLNDEQEAALADGVLTRKEFAASLDAVAMCLEAKVLGTSNALLKCRPPAAIAREVPLTACLATSGQKPRVHRGPAIARLERSLAETVPSTMSCSRERGGGRMEAPAGR